MKVEKKFLTISLTGLGVSVSAQAQTDDQQFCAQLDGPDNYAISDGSGSHMTCGQSYDSGISDLQAGEGLVNHITEEFDESGLPSGYSWSASWDWVEDEDDWPDYLHSIPYAAGSNFNHSTLGLFRCVGMYVKDSSDMTVGSAWHCAHTDLLDLFYASQ